MKNNDSFQNDDIVGWWCIASYYSDSITESPDSTARALYDRALAVLSGLSMIEPWLYFGLNSLILQTSLNMLFFHSISPCEEIGWYRTVITQTVWPYWMDIGEKSSLLEFSARHEKITLMIPLVQEADDRDRWWGRSASFRSSYQVKKEKSIAEIYNWMGTKAGMGEGHQRKAIRR